MRRGSQETTGGRPCRGVWRTWSNGFCNDLEHCVSNYGNEKLTFGTGTRLTIMPSKYSILGQEIRIPWSGILLEFPGCLYKIPAVILDHADLSRRASMCPFS